MILLIILSSGNIHAAEVVTKEYAIGRRPNTFNPEWENSRRYPGKYDNIPGDIRRFYIKNTNNAVDFVFESEDETRSIASSGVPVKRSRFLFEENLETDFKGWIYHPNFISFDIDLENGMRQTKEEFQPASASKWRNSYLNQFHITGSFLRKKPYAFSLSADKSRGVDNRDFFERQIVDSDRYAANFGYRNKVAPIHLSLSSSSKNINRLSRPLQLFDDNEITFDMSNESDVIGSTRLEATYDRFKRNETDTDKQRGTSKDLNLTNQKFFTADRKKSLYSSLYYYDVTGLSGNRILSLTEDANVEYNDYLSNTLTYNFSNRDSSGIRATDNKVNYFLRHKLYESLTSTIGPYYFYSDTTEYTQNVYGFSIDEDYNKKLGRLGRLNMGAGFSYSDDRRDVPNGIISVVDESHALTTGTVTLLDRPLVDTTAIVVTDTTGTVTYVLNTDYQISSSGSSTQIQRTPAGAIANAQEVLVDYTVRTDPSIEFDTLGVNFRTRLDLFDDLVSAYCRISREDHPHVRGQDEIVLQTLTDTVFGIENNYKNMRLNAEYEDYNSSLSPFKRLQFTESYFFNPTEGSTMRFEATQTAIRLTGDIMQIFYNYLGTYSVRLNNYSRFNIDAGYRFQKGAGIDLDDIVASLNYEARFGKFYLYTGYDYKKQMYVNDSLIDHFFSFKAKRIF